MSAPAASKSCPLACEEPNRPIASLEGISKRFGPLTALDDVSMSLDNVLAVAGAAREHPGILILGLILSVALMGLAANLIAKYIERFRWIGWLGLFAAVVGGWLGLLAPASSVIEGISALGFIAFFVFMVSVGIAILVRQRRPATA